MPQTSRNPRAAEQANGYRHYRTNPAVSATKPLMVSILPLKQLRHAAEDRATGAASGDRESCARPARRSLASVMVAPARNRHLSGKPDLLFRIHTCRPKKPAMKMITTTTPMM
jgi:hypothetical protein